MIVQVVPECVDQIDGVVPGSSISVAGKQHCKEKVIMFILPTLQCKVGTTTPAPYTHFYNMCKTNMNTQTLVKENDKRTLPQTAQWDTPLSPRTALSAFILKATYHDCANPSVPTRIRQMKDPL